MYHLSSNFGDLIWILLQRVRSLSVVLISRSNALIGLQRSVGKKKDRSTLTHTVGLLVARSIYQILKERADIPDKEMQCNTYV